MNKSQVEKAVKELENLKLKSEYRCATFKGIKNLSRADLDELTMRLNLYAQTGDVSGYGTFMRPIGSIKEVLVKLGAC